MKRTATVIGSGPNGLSAAIALAQAGFDVEVREAAAVVGGAVRTAEITLPGFRHDLGSAVYPTAATSPFFRSLPLREHGLEWVWSPAEVAHPLDDGTAVLLHRDIGETAAQFGSAAADYRKMFEPLARNWAALARDVFKDPLGLPRRPLLLARFGLAAIWPATVVAKASLPNDRARALFAGLAAHSTLPLDNLLSSAFALIMGAAGHAVGWPIPRGGAQAISNALASVFTSLGGRIQTNARVGSLAELGRRDAILCDVSPRGFLELAGNRLPHSFRHALERYRYAPGVFKVDYALSEPVPWRAQDCLKAATVHVGGTLEETAASERAAWYGEPPDKPFLLVVQPSLFDPSRAPAGRHTLWVYCHVPNGWRGSALAQIEAQMERFAPGFRDCVLARAAHNTEDMRRWNENLIGGDIVGGAYTPKQFVFRPTPRRYATPLRGVYLCSASTPPGGSVHGMCGYYAARWAASDFRAQPTG